MLRIARIRQASGQHHRQHTRQRVGPHQAQACPHQQHLVHMVGRGAVQPGGPRAQQLHQDGGFQAQQQDQTQRTIGAQARILHDQQGLVTTHRATQAITGVCPTIFMKATGQPHTGRHAQAHRHRRRPPKRGQGQHDHRPHAHQRPHQRKVAHAGRHPGRLPPHPGGHWHPGQKLQGHQAQAALMRQRRE